jgi:hypothetical protein
MRFLRRRKILKNTYRENHDDIGKQRMSSLSNYCFAGFCHLRACSSHTHAHTHAHTHTDGRAFLRRDHTGFQGVFLKPPVSVLSVPTEREETGCLVCVKFMDLDN